jgi:hypothetical protein
VATLQRLERFWLRPSGPGSAILASAISAPEKNAGAVRLTALPADPVGPFFFSVTPPGTMKSASGRAPRRWASHPVASARR